LEVVTDECKRVQVQTYRVTPELAGLNSKRKLIIFLITGGAVVAFQLLFEMLWPSSPPGHLLRHSIEAVVLGTVLGLTFSLRLSKQFATYTVAVSDACVTCKWDFSFLPERSIGRNEAKTIVEIDGGFLAKPGLRISKYGRFGTWFFGGIGIPKGLPEYEYVRDLTLSWKARP
jgi:hypothetical protein